MNKLFVVGSEKEYEKELKCAYDRSCGVKFLNTAKAINVGFLVSNDIDVIISNGLSDEEYYLAKGLKIPAITIARKDKYVTLSDIVIDCKAVDDKRYFTGCESKICGNDRFRIDRIVNLIDKLEWDSVFFGFNVAYLSCMHLTDNIMYRAEKFVRRENIRLVEYLCNCHNAYSVRCAERYGFHFVDVRLVYRRPLSDSDICASDFNMRKAEEADADSLAEIARNSYLDSRYYFDYHFTTEQCQAFYDDWVRKSIHGGFDDEVILCEIGGETAGFISVRVYAKKLGKIGLVGVKEKYQGRGIGSALLKESFKWFRERGLNDVEVVTQGRNYGAQRLYQKAGFRTYTVQLWYHKWF